MKKKTVSNIFTFGFISIFALYIYNNPDILTGLGSVSIFALIAIAIGKLLTYFNNGLFTKWTAEQFVPKIKLSETVYISIISAIGNFFGPLLGGTAIRALYMKKVFKLSYSKFTSTIAAFYLIIFLANSLLAIVSLLLLEKTSQTNFLLFIFGSIFVGLLLIPLIRLPKKERLDKYKNKYLRIIITIVYDIESGWRLLLSNKRLMAKLGLLGLIGFAITYVTALVEFRAIGSDISYAALGLYTSLIVLSMLISLTPGALGIREAMVLFIGTTLGVSSEEILQVAIIDRGVNFIVLLGLFLLTRNNKIKKKFTPREML